MAASDDVLADLRKEMENTLVAMRREMARTRTGRASTALLEGITVEYYGAKTPLNQLAGLSAPEPRLLLIQPYDRSVINDIERAILQSDLGLVPQNDGKLIRVPIPALTDERRKDLVKHLHKVLENHRTAVRNIRREINDSFKKLLKDKKMSEDDEKRGLDEAQKLTDQTIARLDEAGKNKEREILTV